MAKSGAARRGSITIGILLGVVTGVMIIGLVWSLTVANRPQTARPAAATTEASAQTTQASATPTPTQTPEASPTPTKTPKPKPSAITSLRSDSYLTVLESLGKRDSTIEQAQKMAAKLSKGGLTVVVVDTDAFPSLTPGYWALVVADADSSQEAKQRCSKLGRPFGDNCYTRHIP